MIDPGRRGTPLRMDEDTVYALRVVGLLVVGLMTAFGVVYVTDSWPVWGIGIGLAWLAVAIVTRGRTLRAWMVLVALAGFPYAVFVGDVFNVPCSNGVPDANETFYGEPRSLPLPFVACRVELAGGRVDDVGTVGYEFFLAYGWWLFATVLAFSRRPGWAWRLAIITASWFPAAFAFFWF